MISKKVRQLICELIIKTRECSNSYKNFVDNKICFYFHDGTIIKLTKDEADIFVKMTYALVSEFGDNKKITNEELCEFILHKDL